MIFFTGIFNGRNRFFNFELNFIFMNIDVNKLKLFCEMKKFSQDQTNTFISILSNKNFNHYIGGNPGTGKSFLLNALKEYLKKKLVITSTTGISAINVHGITLHSFMGIYHLNMDLDDLISKILKRSKSKFKKLEYLVIEECSMCDNFLFSLLEFCLRKARNIDKPFGGVKIILVGDFLQLPPVQDSGFLFESDAFINGNFKIHILTESHRQTEQKFYTLLQECRFGYISNKNYKLLKTREIKAPEDLLRIFSTNKEADDWNTYKYTQIQSKEFIYQAKDEYINEKYKNIFNKNSLIEEILKLKIGCKVILLRNIDFINHLVNGSIGTVIALKPHYVTVEFDNGMIKDIIPETQEYMVDGEIVASRTQIPLRLAYSLTAHKVQGMTLDKAFIDLKKVFAPGQAYVAISRLRTLDGLYLANFSKDSLKTNISAIKFYKENR